MGTQDRFTVVIPLYNKEKEIQRAVKSVLNQEFQEFEVIVIDDGSTDSGPKVVSTINDSRIRTIFQRNEGPSAARNRGIKEARNQIIAFLDADDEWKPGFLKAILRLKEKFAGAGAYATAYAIVLPSGKTVRPKYRHIPPYQWEGFIPSYFRSALGTPPVWTSAVAVPRVVFEDIGLFQVGIGMAEDKEMWERIGIKYPIAFTQEIGATYFMNASNRVCNEHVHLYRERPFINTALNSIKKGEVSERIVFDLKEYISQLNLSLAANCVFNYDRPDKAREYVRKSFPKTIRVWIKKYLLRFVLLFPFRAIRLFWKLKTDVRQLVKAK
jgi:glycosyltransferase involved in cell wall biosynthesis